MEGAGWHAAHVATDNGIASPRQHPGTLNSGDAKPQ